MTRIAIALTGASGAPYFVRLVRRLEALPEADHTRMEVSLLSSDAGRRVFNEEIGTSWQKFESRFEKISERDIGASIASGSHGNQALVILPCSMSTLAAIAYGLTHNLIHRAAAVQLKERRKLILVTRETPLSLIHLRGMQQLSESGALIMPASPSFYMQPKSIEDLLDTVVDRIMDHIELDDAHIKRWGR